MITQPAHSIFISVHEAATKMGVTCSRLYQLISAGELPAIKRGRRVLIPARAFENFVENINRQALENINRHALENLNGTEKGQPDV